jgi:hypothetical protein
MELEKMLRQGRLIGEIMIGSAFILLVGLCLSLEVNSVNTSEFLTMVVLYLLLLATGVVLKQVSMPDTMPQPHSQVH